jgi:hypothetical protein
MAGRMEVDLRTVMGQQTLAGRENASNTFTLSDGSEKSHV